MVTSVIYIEWDRWQHQYFKYWKGAALDKVSHAQTHLVNFHFYASKYPDYRDVPIPPAGKV